MALRRGVGAALAALSATTAYRYSQVKARESKLPSTILPEADWSQVNSSSSLKNGQQRVVIVGAGVVGVSTAYKLAIRGHKVLVLEPQPNPGDECSACAAGGMSKQNVVVDKNTWNAVLRSLAPKIVHKFLLGGQDDFQFFHINWFSSLSDPFFLRWALTFTTTSLLPNSEQLNKQKNMLDFTKFAVEDMVNMFEDPQDDIARKAGYNTRGSLAVSYETKNSDAKDGQKSFPRDTNESDSDSKATTSEKSDPGKGGLTVEPHCLIESTEEVLALEPSLKYQAKLPVRAKYEYETKSASSGRFAKELATRCENDPRLDVTFVYNTKVLGVDTDSGDKGNESKQRVTALKTNRGVFTVPKDAHVVIAAGAWTPHILAFMGLYAPVYPLKGYAMSVNAQEVLKQNSNLRPKDLPSRIVSDKYMYTTRLGNEIRITSIGEFSEWDTAPTKHVDQIFRSEAIRQFPQLHRHIEKAKTYCGHRPYVSDGILLLGECSDTLENMYVSCGPGSNGWKLALGSGEIIARLISGQTCNQIQDELGFDPTVFSPEGRILRSPFFASLCRARWNI